MKHKIMSHLIAGYPDYQSALTVARALNDGGAAYLEIQFPFSDGTADGPLIQAACTQALAAGFTVKQGFQLVEEIRRFSSLPIYIMTYANIAFVNGIRSFLDQIRGAGANGAIIPDLPPDSDENLYSTGKAMGLTIIPVIAPSISDARLQMIFNKKVEFIYASLRKGITGEKTEIGEENIAFIKRISAGGNKIIGGFGIRSYEQVDLLSNHIHASIVGSEFLRVINQAIADKASLYDAVMLKMKNLSGL